MTTTAATPAAPSAAPETLTLEQLASIALERSERIRLLADARMNELFAAIVAAQH